MPTVTLGQMRQRVYDNLDHNAGFFPIPQVNGAINQGLSRLNCILGFRQDTLAVPGFTVAGQYLYATPVGLLVPMRAYCEGRELSKLSLNELGQSHRAWISDTTLRGGVVSRWATIGLRQFVIHPADATGGRFLEVQGILGFIPLVNDNDVVTLEDPWVDLVVNFAQARVLLKDATPLFAAASVTYQDWVRKLKTMTIWAGLRWPQYYLLKVLNPVEKNEKVV